MTRTPGKARPSSSAVRSRPTVTSAQLVPSQCGHRQAAARAPHQPHAGIAAAARHARADRRSATQRAGSPAVGAHEHRRVARPRDLHEHRARRAAPPCGLAPGRRRDAGADRGSGAACCCGEDDPRLRAARGRDVAHPADLDEALAPRRCGCGRRRPARAPLQLLPDERGVARVHAGRERLGEQRVAVVPDRDEAERVQPARRPPSGCRRRCRALVASRARNAR